MPLRLIRRRRQRPQSARRTQRMLNLWPPLLFSGIRITHLADDFTRIRAKLAGWRSTQNLHGSQFGGSLFAMTDPIYSLMLNGIFHGRCYVWDKAAEIEFVKPGRGAVYLDCSISREEIAAIEAAIAGGGKYLPEFTVRLYDDHGDTVDLVRRVVYVRLKKELRPPPQEETS